MSPADAWTPEPWAATIQSPTLGELIWRAAARIVSEHEYSVDNVVAMALYQGRVVTHVERWPHATVVRSWDEEIGAVPVRKPWP
jgi:hypothetical protein